MMCRRRREASPIDGTGSEVVPATGRASPAPFAERHLLDISNRRHCICGQSALRADEAAGNESGAQKVAAEPATAVCQFPHALCAFANQSTEDVAETTQVKVLATVANPVAYGDGSQERLHFR